MVCQLHGLVDKPQDVLGVRMPGLWRDHLVSNDLVTWKHLPPAIIPTPGWYDADGCFSGSCVSCTGLAAHRIDAAGDHSRIVGS
jgi:sucrose-6-phosphate hydrolase SacC (GH32 family)